MAEPDNLDGLAKGCALIQSNLHVNADGIETEENGQCNVVAPCGWNAGATATWRRSLCIYSGTEKVKDAGTPTGHRSRVFFREERPAEGKHIADKAYAAENVEGGKEVSEYVS